MTQLGAQMFTVRAFTQTESNLLSTFRKLRAIGYEAVQISAIGAGIPVPAVAAGLKETGLACAATHISFDDCKKDLAAVVEKHRAWGCEYVGVGSMPEAYRADAAGFARFAREASDVADALASGKLAKCGAAETPACIVAGVKREDGEYPVIRALPTTIFETEASGAVAADKVGTTLQLNETADGVTTTANGPFTVTWADGGTLVRGYFEPAAASV